MLNEVLKAVEPHLIRTNTSLTVHTEHTEIMVDMDHRRIERVLRNLLFNAVEHSEGQPIDVYVDATESTLGVAVRDHGIGLSPEEAEQVFNRFWRADTSRKRTLGGTGLGLSIAKALTELGDAEAGRIEAKFSRLALDSIAASGDGSEEEPCSVLRIEDEYNILRASSQRPTAQRQVSDERGQFDVHTLEDGGEVWFRLLWLAPPAAAQEDEAGDAPEN